MRMPGLLARLVRLLARWLHGLAARLDQVGRPAFAPATLDALAQRFPGAPEHWLRAIAEHVDAFEPVAADAADVPEAAPQEEAAATPAAIQRARTTPSRRPRPELSLSQLPRERPADRQPFRSSRPHRRPALRWLTAVAATPPQEWEIPASHQRSEAPAIRRTAATRAPRRWTSLIGRLLGSHPVRPTAPMSELPQSHLPELSAVAPPAGAGRIFALMASGPRRRNPFVNSAHEAAASPVPEWPESRSLLRPIDLHRAAADNAVRPIDNWAVAAEGCWPALPGAEQTIADATPGNRPLHDFNREQMAGLWSG
jgi:hypothetical protein